MTALFVWWRRNFGHRNDPVRWLSEVVPGGFRDWWTCHPLREWWRHRNDQPAMLPDRVTWTVLPEDLCRGETGPMLVARLNLREDLTSTGGDKWRLHDVVHDGEHALPVLRREDGAYRWRDDGYRGF